MAVPRVSVVIPVYNSRDFIAATLDSVLAQTLHDVEVVVVDDSSSDGTAETVRAYGDRLRYIRQDNAGVSAARNRGILASSGRYVAFIDHDDVWAPDKLERQVEVFESRPEVGLLYSNCAFVNAAGHRIGPYLTAQRMHRGRVLPELLLDCFVPLLTAVVRRDVIDGVGLFNSRWGIAEDYDFFLRVAERHEFDFVPDMLGGYRLHSNNTSSDVTRLRREESEVLEIALSRRPEMMGELGQRAVRMRLAGVRMGRDQALVLAGRGRELAALGLPPMSPARRSKTVLAYLVALMGPRAVIRLERYYGRIRKALGKPGMETRLPEHAAPDTV